MDLDHEVSGFRRCSNSGSDCFENIKLQNFTEKDIVEFYIYSLFSLTHISFQNFIEKDIDKFTFVIKISSFFAV